MTENKVVSFLCFLWLVTLISSAIASDDSGLCKIKLHSLSKVSGAPGDTFEMVGIWGETQGIKTPSINKGGGNKLGSTGTGVVSFYNFSNYSQYFSD